MVHLLYVKELLLLCNYITYLTPKMSYTQKPPVGGFRELGRLQSPLRDCVDSIPPTHTQSTEYPQVICGYEILIPDDIHSP